ncbi:MAG: GntR family transcriptional regulator [Thiotrichaceae bacterium]|nr:GntR family transcriptional regulator [Thiotrichaceae bacterium]
MQIGNMNRMTVLKRLDFGVYLDGKELGEILLPIRYVPIPCDIGSEIAIFLYRDSDDRLIATTETPKVMVGECASLKAVDVNRVGAFMDWGLPKDLLVPHCEQNGRMTEGHNYIVNVYLDDEDRIVGTAKLDGWLSETGVYFKPLQPVRLLIFGETDLGYKAVVNHTHIGLIYKNEVFQKLNYGRRVEGYIKEIREDGKIDLMLQLPANDTRDELMEKILTHLKDNNGTSTLVDKSSPEDISNQYSVSKKNYKKALSSLYKQRLITITKTTIHLN